MLSTFRHLFVGGLLLEQDNRMGVEVDSPPRLHLGQHLVRKKCPLRANFIRQYYDDEFATPSLHFMDQIYLCIG